MRIAIVEIGHWHAGGYATGLRQLGEEIVAVSDHDADAAQRKAGHIGCKAYASHIEMIETERPDFVFAHGIHNQMTQIADDLVELDVPFVMEKPMGVDWTALSAVADKAEAKGLFVGVDLVMRCYKLTQVLLGLKESGEFGRMTNYYHRLLAGEPQRYHGWNVPWVLDREQAGGGPLFNFGPHVIDLFLLFAQQDVQSVFCRASHGLHDLDVEDFASVSLVTTGGVVGTIEVGYVCPDSKYDRFFSVCTDQLFVSSADFDSGTVLLRDGRELDVAGDDTAPRLNYVSEILRRFQAGELPVAPIRDMCRVLRAINAAVESAETGQPVTIE